ncbi:ADP-heptosyltransferase [Leptospira ryugenii]|uniref:lipopolysaccharide heptosyltransferase II n=1 Tax=Leptospira ryugenii TaxID=1917863 RepID=A0A2P2DX17_9LEPT|nr:lipopolysaccharide heptosyltransferase II [Leptospira ryugenii]GBF49177.1 ADP-heptosyltransferase [Leptospira ryugenii]
MKEKILILQTAFLGDLVLSTPFFRALRLLHPEAEIHLVCNLGTESILEGNPDLNAVFPIDKKGKHKGPWGFFQFALALREEGYSKVYAAHFSFRSSLLSWLTGAKERIGYQESGFAFLHTKKVPRPKMGMHEVDKLFSLCYDSTVDFPSGRNRRPFLYPRKADSDAFWKIANEWKLIPKSYIIIAPSSLWETKRMPEEKFVSLISYILRKRKESIVLVGSKADISIQQRIDQLLKIQPLKPKERQRLFSLIGKTSLGELAVWIERAKALVSNDSSPIHFASAFDIPTIMIYGATVPAFGYSSLSTKQRIMEVGGLSCRPCGIHGGRECPEAHFKCMLNQDPEKIFRSLNEIIGSKS